MYTSLTLSLYFSPFVEQISLFMLQKPLV